MSGESNASIRVLADNRRARHEYFIDDTLECGVSLLGTEVKSMKNAQFSFNDAWVEVDRGQLVVRNLHINAYKMATDATNHEPDRKKYLLAHRAEIAKLERKVEEKGYTLIPVRFYLKNGRVKIEVGLCKGKKLYDKRESIKEKDQKRDTDRELRSR